MGRPSKTSAQATSKKVKNKENKLKNGSETKSFNPRLKCSRWCRPKWPWKFFQKVKISSLTYFDLARCAKIEVVLTRIGRIFNKKPNPCHSYPIRRKLHFSKNSHRRARKLCKRIRSSFKEFATSRNSKPNNHR